MKSGLWALLVIVEACSKHFAYLSGHGTEVDRGGYSTPAVWTSIQWNSIPGAANVWESNSYSVGTYVFFHKAALPAWMLPRITKATLSIMVDDSYVAKMNGVVVGSGGLGTVYTHEVPLDLLLGCDSSSYSENLLVMSVYNNPGYGALLYQCL